MKTETERLKEATEAQYRKERFEELQQYIDTLMLEMETAFASHNRFFRLEMLALPTFIIALIFTEGLIESLAQTLWFALFAFNWFWYQPKIIRSLANLDSCFETLRILGLISRDDQNGRGRKLRRFRDNPIERLWAKIKREKQEEVYGTA